MIPLHITITEDAMEKLEQIKEDRHEIENNSAAIRYALLQYDKPDPVSVLKTKLNSMEKKLSILLEIVPGGFLESGITTVPEKEDTGIYRQAKRRVEDDIQRQITKNMLKRKKE